MNTENRSVPLGAGSGADKISAQQITCIETRTEKEQGPELSCGDAEQEEVLVTGTDLIIVTVFVCPVYCVLWY